MRRNRRAGEVGAPEGRAGELGARAGLSGRGGRPDRRLRLVRRLATRHQRDKLELFVAEGEDLVDAARAAGVEPVELLVSGENVEPAELASVSTLAHPPRVIGIFRRDSLQQTVTRPGPGLALWHLGDPGNVGALIRSADALDGAFVALSPGCADPTGPKAIRASMGAVFRVPLIGFDEAPIPWVALVPRGGIPLSDVEATTFVLGAERESLPLEVLQRCAERATIPIATGAESLNVAAAGAIALYERARRQTAPAQ